MIHKFVSLHSSKASLSFLNAVLFTQQIPNKINLLCTDYDPDFRLEKTET